MDPQDQQQKELLGQPRHRVRGEEPQIGQHPLVIVGEAEQQHSQPHIDRVRQEQRRDRQSQQKLPALARRNAKMPPAIQRVQT
jgi:hypothetical protein